MTQHPGRVSIIGAGTLGGTIAYSLMMGNHVKEILLIDRSNMIVQGQVLDLMEASEGTDIIIRAGTFKEAGQSDIIIVTADTPFRSSESRQTWLAKSNRLLLSIASSLSPLSSDVMILVASDPVDLYVQSLQSYFPHIPPSKIFGIGTTMGTARLRSWLAQVTDHKSEIRDVYCIGSQSQPVVVWSSAKINDTLVKDIPSIQRETAESVVSDHRLTLVIERKGKAWYGMSAVITRLVADILNGNLDRKGKAKAKITTEKVWVLSVFVPKYDACISWPVYINQEGVEKVMDLDLSSEETTQVNQVIMDNMSDFHTSVGTI